MNCVFAVDEALRYKINTNLCEEEKQWLRNAAMKIAQKRAARDAPSREKKPDFHVDLNQYSRVSHVVGVVSGKGGVGKSFVTASMANAMAAMGYRVGILDADITGPSIPRMYGLHGTAGVDDQGIQPAGNGQRNQSDVRQSAAGRVRTSL